MKKLIADIFTQSNNKTWSYLRILIIPPLLIISIIQICTNKGDILHTAKAIGVLLISFAFTSFFGTLIEDGSLQSLINRFKKVSHE